EIIDKYGADALRLTLITGNAPGNDMRFYNERVENSRNFANKVWNASRFIMMNMAEGEEAADINKMPEGLEPVDHWIISKLNNTIKEVTDNMDHFELGIAVQKVYDFIWDEFCDWYIEMVKPRLYNSDNKTSHDAAMWTLQIVLTQALKLLHPYMPFVTEEIFCTVQDKEESIMISEWPVYRDEWNFVQDEKEIETIKEAVRGIRNIRTQMNVAPSRKALVYVVSDKDEVLDIFRTGKLFFESLAGASESICQKDKAGIDDDAVSVVLAEATLYMPFSDLVDISAEIERLEKEKAKLEGELKRSKAMLSNEKFLSKAPEAKINEEKDKQQKYEQTYAQVCERLGQLKK
nr:class I tRNA ligase family protein [Butyrivibrio sp.]